eukprot:CAMPEP_0182531388 /NCGR_PEP_ID=MMETSP1323-20130603/8823_1 /TAXON_ID=236787 /ORGANISM="Florenciella parvula, Strain RCC1693" /LENGTH=270 /DNA_ID=CAMNT_0024740935 /DNA_START=255 /DNA_END=1063 /DNA_ORIENTATION=-
MAAADDDNAAGLDDALQIPPDFICPITQELMRDPVNTLSGHSYERDAILQWFAGGTTKCPLTGVMLGSRHLTPNHNLRKAIENFREKMPHLKDQQNQLDNLAAAIKLREADLTSRASKDTVTKEEYDRVVALLRRTQGELEQAREFARRVVAAGAQLLGDEPGAGREGGQDLDRTQMEWVGEQVILAAQSRVLELIDKSPSKIVLLNQVQTRLRPPLNVKELGFERLIHLIGAFHEVELHRAGGLGKEYIKRIGQAAGASGGGGGGGGGG